MSLLEKVLIHPSLAQIIHGLLSLSGAKRSKFGEGSEIFYPPFRYPPLQKQNHQYPLKPIFRKADTPLKKVGDQTMKIVPGYDRKYSTCVFLDLTRIICLDFTLSFHIFPFY